MKTLAATTLAFALITAGFALDLSVDGTATGVKAPAAIQYSSIY
jgi:hypothetical protein